MRRGSSPWIRARAWFRRSKGHLIPAATVAAIYLLGGALWILLTDRLLLRLFVNDPQRLTQLQTYKGWAFVVGSAGLIFVLCTRHIARILRHHRAEVLLRHQVESFAWQTAAALAKTVEQKDGYTGEHCERIARLADAVAEAMGLSHERRHHLYYAALVHDIGKMEVPDAVLNKPGGLTDAEWALMKQHLEHGADLLRTIRHFRPVAEIVEQHHEAWDGSGYPQGLAGEAIRIEARILSVVDAFDAMTTDRPYRDALSEDEALQELRANAGTQFDPDVVRAFLNQRQRRRSGDDLRHRPS